MGFEEYLARFISSLLYSYSEEEIDKTNVESFSISRNSLSTKLKDIIIYRNSFLQHGLPFCVRFGTISNISMKLSLKEFNQFEITDIFFYLQFVDSKNFPTIQELNEMRDHQLYAHELFKEKISLIMNKYLLSNFNEQIKSMISNSLVSVSKIYFCIELNDSIIGVYIDRIMLVGNQIEKNQNTEKNELDEDLKLKMSLLGLKVFMMQKNNNNPFSDNDENSVIIQKMKQFFSNMESADENDQQTDYIINMEQIDGLIIYDKDKNFQILLNNQQKIEDKLQLTLWQIGSLAKIIPEMIKFYKYFVTKHIQRPDFLLRQRKSIENSNNNDNISNESNNKNDDISDAWIFVHRCAIELNTDRYISDKVSNPIIGKFIPSFKKRIQYLKIWQSYKNKPFNPKLLYELDHTLTYHQITLFRYMTETLRKKWSRKPLAREDVYKAFEFIEMDLPNLVMFFLKRSTISVHFSKIITNLELYQEEKKKYFLSFSIINPNITIKTDQFDNINAKFGFSSFKLKDSLNNNIIESIENGSQGFNFLVSFYSQAFRVHNNIISKKMKVMNDNNFILDDLTIMKISAMITNVIFYVSRNEFFNFLKNFNLAKLFSILFPPSTENDNNNNENDDLFKSQLELSALFNINQSSPLDSLFEKIDIDFIMDSCRLTVLINEPFQLTFVYDKMIVQRQLEQLELENKNLSVNAKSKVTNNVRKIFRKSDLIFDVVNANLIFGNSRIEKVIATEISVHTIFMVRQKKILIFISPLFFQSNWNEIKQIKEVFSELLASIEKFKSESLNSFALPDISSSFEIPQCIKEIEISGGIPTITLSLDMPSSKHKLLTFIIDTVKFGGLLDNFELKATVNKIIFEDLVDISNVTVDLKKKHFVFEKVSFSMLKSLSIMPKDLMSILTLTPITANFSFLMKTLSVDLSVDWIEQPIDYTVTNFSGYSDVSKNGKIFLKCFVNCINLCHKALVKNQDVTGTIDLNRTINIYVDFGDLELIFLHEIFGLAFNQKWRIKDVFPVDFVLDWTIKADSILIDELFYAENAMIYLQMSDVAFGGDVMIESLEAVYMKIDKKDPISISFDLTRHYFSACVNFDYIEIDFFRIASLIQYFLHFPFHITCPLILDVRIMPMTIGLIFDQSGKTPLHPTLSVYESIDENSLNNSNDNLNENDDVLNDKKDDMIFVNLRSSVYFDGFNVSLALEVHDFDVFYGDEKFLSIPYIEIFGDNQWKMNIPFIDSQFSSIQLISKLLKTVSSIPRFSFELWNIQHSLKNILTTFKINSIRCLLKNSVEMNVNQIFANFLNNELNMKFSMLVNLYSTWFVCSELMKIEEIKFQCLINNESVQAKALISQPIQIKCDNSTVNCLKNFLNTSSSKSFLTIINNTNHNFTTKFGEIEAQSTFEHPEFVDENEFELSFDHGTIPIKGDNFYNRGEMKIIFENFENELVLYLNELNHLKISYAFSVVNKTESNFKLEYKNKKYQLNSKSVLNDIPKITGNFKLNGQTINLDINGSFMFNNVYLVKLSKRSIVIKPEYFIINECPFDISINNVHYKRYSKSELIMNIINNPVAKIESVVFPSQPIDFSELISKKYFSYKLKTVYDFDLSFVLRVQVIEQSKSAKTLVFSPSVIIKCQIQNLLISHDKLNCFPLNHNNDFAFSPHKKFISRVFLTTAEDFGFYEIVLCENESKKELNKLIVLDSIKDDRTVYPLIIKRKIKKYPYYNIEIIKVCPFLKVVNKTGLNLVINLPNAKNILIEKDKFKEFQEFESSFNFSFSIEEPLSSPSQKKIRSQQSRQLFNNLSFNSKSVNNEVRPFLFNFKKICSQKVISSGFSMPIEISVSSQKDVSTKVLTFSLSKTFPCRIINLSKFSLSVDNREFGQKAAHLYAPSCKAALQGDFSHSAKINVRNNTIIFPSNPFIVGKIGSGSISCEVSSTPSPSSSPSRNGEVESEVQSEVPLLDPIEIFYDEEHITKNGSLIREIVISESIEEIRLYKLGLINTDAEMAVGNCENEERPFIFTFESHVNDVSISLFEKDPQIGLVLHAKGIRVLAGQSAPTGDFENGDGFGGYVKNQLFLSLSNVEIRDFNRHLVLATKEKREFFKISAANAFSPFHVEEVGFSIKPFYFRLNLSLFSYLISAFSELTKSDIFSGDEAVNDESEVSFLTLFDNGLIEKVEIDPISVLFAFEVGQNISPNFPQFLRVIPSVKPFHFSMKKCQFDNIRLNDKSIVSSKVVQSEFLSKSGKVNFLAKNASKFIFSLNIFGSPYSLFEHLFFKQFNAFSIFSFIFGFVENISDYIRSVCHFFSGQENLRLKDQKAPVLWGFTSLFLCVFNGFGIFLNCVFKDKNPMKALWRLFFSAAGGVFDAISGICVFLKSLFEDDFDIEREIQADDS